MFPKKLWTEYPDCCLPLHDQCQHGMVLQIIQLCYLQYGTGYAAGDVNLLPQIRMAARAMPVGGKIAVA